MKYTKKLIVTVRLANENSGVLRTTATKPNPLTPQPYWWHKNSDCCPTAVKTQNAATETIKKIANKNPEMIGVDCVNMIDIVGKTRATLRMAFMPSFPCTEKGASEMPCSFETNPAVRLRPPMPIVPRHP